MECGWCRVTGMHVTIAMHCMSIGQANDKTQMQHPTTSIVSYTSHINYLLISRSIGKLNVQ